MAHPWDSQEGLPAGEGTGSGDGVQRVSQVNSQVSGVSGRPSCCDKIAQTWQLEGRTFPSHGCGGCKSKVTVPADSVSAEAPSGAHRQRVCAELVPRFQCCRRKPVSLHLPRGRSLGDMQFRLTSPRERDRGRRVMCPLPIAGVPLAVRKLPCTDRPVLSHRLRTPRSHSRLSSLPSDPLLSVHFCQVGLTCTSTRVVPQ